MIQRASKIALQERRKEKQHNEEKTDCGKNHEASGRS